MAFANYFKIISETQAIQVNFGEGMESIGTAYTSVALNSASEVGNQEEFDTKFNEVVTVLMEKASVWHHWNDTKWTLHQRL